MAINAIRTAFPILFIATPVSLFISGNASILHHLGVFRRKGARAALAVHHYMPSLALSQQHSVARPQNLVRELDSAAAQLDDPRANDDYVVVSGGGAVLHAGLGNRQKSVGLRFHVAVIEPVIAAQFDPPDLEPDQVIRVINDAGLIGLGVTDAQPRLAPFVMVRFAHNGAGGLSRILVSNTSSVIILWSRVNRQKNV